MTISTGQTIDANDILNIYHTGGNVLIGKTGTLFVPIIINNVNGVTNVKLYLWGKAAGGSATTLVHGVSGHDHGDLQLYMAGSATGVDTFSSGSNYNSSYIRMNGGDSGTGNAVGRNGYSTTLAYTYVPQALQIWIDGTEYTATIGDTNTKGSTMYDSVNDDWGVDGTTEWDSGVLDLTSLITWTAGVHELELKETGGSGGTLVYQVSVNAGF